MLFMRLFKEILDTFDISAYNGFLRIRFNVFDKLEFEIKIKNRIIIDVH